MGTLALSVQPQLPAWALTSLESDKAVLRMSVKGPGEGCGTLGEGGQEARCLSLSEEQGDQFCCLQNRVGRNFSFKGATIGKKTRRKNLTEAMGSTPRKNPRAATATPSDSLDPCDVWSWLLMFHTWQEGAQLRGIASIRLTCRHAYEALSCC